MTHEPTTEELRFLADRDLAQDKDHMLASGDSLDWLIAQLTQWPIRVDEDKTTNIRFLMMSAANTLRQMRDADTKYVVHFSTAGIQPPREFDNEADARAFYEEERAKPHYLGPPPRRGSFFKRTILTEDLSRG